MATAGFALGACSSPAPQAGFDSPDPVERTMAAAEVIRAQDKGRVRELIVMLDSDDPALRLIAINGLERLTGETHGYAYADPPPKRMTAIDRWVRWADGEPGKDVGAEP